MSIANIFKLSYFFDNFPGSTFPGSTYILAVLVLIVLASVIVSYKAGKWSYFKKQIAIRLTRTGFVIGWFGLAWIWLRFEGVPYLSWRLWPAILFIYLVMELVYLVKFVKFDFPKQRAKKISKGDRDLYLRRFLGK